MKKQFALTMILSMIIISSLVAQKVGSIALQHCYTKGFSGCSRY